MSFDFLGVTPVQIIIALMTVYVSGAAFYLAQSNHVGVARLQAIANAHGLLGTTAIRPFLDPSGDYVREPEFYRDYRLPSAGISALTILLFAVILFGDPVKTIVKNGGIFLSFSDNSIGPTAAVTTMMVGFLSAYIWSISMLLRRVMARDISAMAFNQVTARVVISVLLSLIAYHLISGGALTDSVPSSQHVQLIVVAFVIGHFPEVFIRWVHEIGRRLLKQPQQSEEFGLEFIEGIDLYTRARLSEVDINDAQALAASNPLNLLFRSSYNISQIMDWIGQAQLYLLLKSERLAAVRACGIRTSYQLYALLPEKVDGDNSIVDGKSIPINIDVMKKVLAEDFSFRRALEVHEALLASLPAPSPVLLLADTPQSAPE